MNRHEMLNAAGETRLLVHLVRHGQAYDTHRPAGEPAPPNPALTPDGVAETRRLAARLRPLGIGRLLSSPMRRAIETAAILSESLDLPVEVWPDCYEHRARSGYWCWGARELQRRYPALQLPPDLGDDDWYYGEERLDQAIVRADRFLNWLRDQSSSSEKRHLVVVTHGGFTGVVLARILGADPGLIKRKGGIDFDNTSVTTLHVAADQVRILSFNDTSHLIGTPDLDPLRGVNR